MTNANGETSALIAGVVGTVTHTVQESESDDGVPDWESAHGNLRELVFNAVTVTLTKEGHTVDELIELVITELDEQGYLRPGPEETSLAQELPGKKTKLHTFAQVCNTEEESLLSDGAA